MRYPYGGRQNPRYIYKYIYIYIYIYINAKQKKIRMLTKYAKQKKGKKKYNRL